jgi:DNA-binding transcriptional ArsR family regulator
VVIVALLEGLSSSRGWMESLVGTGRLTAGPLCIEWVEHVVQRMRIVGGCATRIRILLLLEQREATVLEIAEELGMLHAAVSNQLGVMRMNGLVSGRGEGRHVRYALADYSACVLLRAASDGIAGRISELSDLACPDPA